MLRDSRTLSLQAHWRKVQMRCALTGGATLVAVFASQASAQLLPTTSTDLRSGSAFNDGLKVTAEVPSLFANHAPFDALLTFPRAGVTTRESGGSQHPSTVSVLTFSYSTDSAAVAEAALCDISSIMFPQQSFQSCVALPQKYSVSPPQAVAEDTHVTSTASSLRTTSTARVLGDFNNDGVVDFFDYLDFTQASSTSAVAVQQSSSSGD